jgi:hypothetical protein
MAKTDLAAIASPGSRALRVAKYEKYCRLRASFLPRIQAYRGIGLGETSDDAVAYINACQLERRPGIRARIEYLSRQDEELIAVKRRRIEETLWAIHEADPGNYFETYDAAGDKDGKLETGETGKMQTVKKQRLSDLPPDLRKQIEHIHVDSKGNMIPQLYSKVQANAELRKMLNIGSQREPDQTDVSRLSDAELIAQLADQAKQLGIEINLNYDFTSAPPPPATPAASEPTEVNGGQVIDSGSTGAVEPADAQAALPTESRRRRTEAPAGARKLQRNARSRP